MVTLAKSFQSLGGLVLLFSFVFFGNAWRRRKVSIQLLSCYIRTCHEIRDFFGYPRRVSTRPMEPVCIMSWDIGKAQANNAEQCISMAFYTGKGIREAELLNKKKKIATHVHRDAQSISLETNSYSLSTSKTMLLFFRNMTWDFLRSLLPLVDVRLLLLPLFLACTPQPCLTLSPRGKDKPGILVCRRNAHNGWATVTPEKGNLHLRRSSFAFFPFPVVRRPKHHPRGPCDLTKGTGSTCIGFLREGAPKDCVPPRLFFPMSIPFFFFLSYPFFFKTTYYPRTCQGGWRGGGLQYVKEDNHK